MHLFVLTWQQAADAASRVADLEQQLQHAKDGIERARASGEAAGRREGEDQRNELAARLHTAEQQLAEARAMVKIREREAEVASGQARAAGEERAGLLERLREAEKSSHAATWDTSDAKHAADARSGSVAYMMCCTDDQVSISLTRRIAELEWALDQARAQTRAEKVPTADSLIVDCAAADLVAADAADDLNEC